jgi:RNA polymerase sigma factor (sigma-70 family)
VKHEAAVALPSRPSPGAAGARLAELYEGHARMVYGVCRLLLRDPDEAEDAAQQVFLSAYRSLLAGTEPRDPGAWLGTIARNEARGRIVTRMREPLALDDEREPASSTLEEQAVLRAEFADLRAELAALPEKQREAVVLRDLYGLRYDEVAKALGTSRPAVEALLFRGRRRLQQRLRPGFAAGVLVVPLALRESIAYAVPGFAAGGASTAGVLVKLAGVPLAAKLAAAGAAVSVAGSAGVLAERELRDPPGRPPRVPVEQATPVAPIAAAVRVFSSPVRMEAADDLERDKAHATDDADPAEADESGELEERGQESRRPADADDDRHARSTTQTVDSGDEDDETEATETDEPDDEPDEPDDEPDDRSSDGGEGD